MGAYNSAIITTSGQTLIANAISGGGTVTFSSMQASSYSYPEGTNIADLTSLQDVQQTVQPFSAQVFNDTMIQVSARFDNSEVSEAYLVQTIGIFAQLGEESPVLLAVVQATTPDQMPAQSAVSPSAFIYNIQITVQQATSISVSVNPSGTATVQDILDLQQQINAKVQAIGGNVSDTVSDAEEPEDAIKYPDIPSTDGTAKTLFGYLVRWVKSLKADKVDASGGDINGTKVSKFTTSSDPYPVPVAGDSLSAIMGKVVKFFSDIRSATIGACYIGQLVSNNTTNNTNLPASAAAVYQEAQLRAQQFAQLNSDKLNKSAIVSQYKKLQINNVLIQFGRLECLVDYYGRASITFPESYSDAELYSCIAIPMAQNYAVRSIINNGANNSLALLVDNNGDYPEYQSKIWMQYIVIGT